jgi:hypothetical protein
MCMSPQVTSTIIDRYYLFQKLLVVRFSQQHNLDAITKYLQVPPTSTTMRMMIVRRIVHAHDGAPNDPVAQFLGQPTPPVRGRDDDEPVLTEYHCFSNGPNRQFEDTIHGHACWIQHSMWNG